MRYLQHKNVQELSKEYDYIIGWGTGPIFRMNYRSYYYKLDFLIDGTEKTVGETMLGIEIKSPSYLCKISGKILIVIYAIYEAEIIEQILHYNADDNIHIIIYSMLDITLKNGVRIPKIYSKNCEDIIILSLINQLGLNTVKYIEIGVCHPIMRNNTFMLNELFSQQEGYQGVLVEANPMCWGLFEDHRKNDKLLKMGISAQDNVKELTFYAFPGLLGHSTFNKELAAETKIKGYDCKEYIVTIKRINEVIAENFDCVPDLLAIDAERLDYQILGDLDSDRYPIQIIVAENMEDSENKIGDLMKKKGYKFYAKTVENTIWTRMETNIFI